MDAKSDLYVIVITLTRILIQRSAHLRRVCNNTWRRRLRNLSRVFLLRKLQFLINHAHLRIIVKCYNQGLFTNDRDILRIIYNEIVQRGLRDKPYYKIIVNRYEEQHGK